VTDQLESGSGRGRLTVPSGEPRHQCFGGICEHRGVRRSCFHPVRAERRRSVGDQCDVTPTPSRLRHRISCYIADSAGCRTWRDSTIVSIAMRRARESPVRPIARIGCCVSPQPISYTRPQALSDLLAFVANDRMAARWLCGSVDSVYGRDQCGFFASRKRPQRSTGSRRSAPWNGSTHPGYSGGSTLTSSNCVSSSWVSMSSAAARLS
jgi:hypothetical protein